ncbi:MAG: hypothetical protein H6983_21110 [Ectothiorhodospiraceae bacterium]|nr:hypothetical protein [Ectothiorhodospiraceae bacterium]
MRDLDLGDLTLIACTAWDEPVFSNLVGYVERGETRPLLARAFPLERIADAQRELLAKLHVGNLVPIPPPGWRARESAARPPRAKMRRWSGSPRTRQRVDAAV